MALRDETTRAALERPRLDSAVQKRQRRFTGSVSSHPFKEIHHDQAHRSLSRRTADGRRWRRTDPSLPDDVQEALRSHLGKARSAVRAGKRAGDERAVELPLVQDAGHTRDERHERDQNDLDQIDVMHGMSLSCEG